MLSLRSSCRIRPCLTQLLGMVPVSWLSCSVTTYSPQCLCNPEVSHASAMASRFSLARMMRVAALLNMDHLCVCVWVCVSVHLLTHRRARGSSAAQVAHSSSVAANIQHSRQLEQNTSPLLCCSKRILMFANDRHRPWEACQPECDTQIHMTGLDNSNKRPDNFSGSPMT